MANKKKQSIKEGLKEDAKLWLKGAKKGVETAALVGGLGGVGRKVGEVAGKAIARKVAEEASPKILKAANAAKGSGKMVVKEAEKGKKIATAAKRDVVVKTQDKTLATNKFINKKGEQSIKVATKKPTVRVVEKEVTAKTAANRTKAANQLRYGASKAEAARGREAIKSSQTLAKGGAKTGASAGAATGAVAVTAKKKKDK